MTTTYLAVADIHGHLSLFEKALAYADEKLGRDYVLVTLGDYVDNGPQIPALLDRLVALKRERGDRFVPIMGNHDLACARTLGWQGGAPDDAWWTHWGYRFGGSTTQIAYRASNAADLARKMPKAHQEFLQGLPWFHETDEYVFVHAGLLEEPLRPQLDVLAAKRLPKGHVHTVEQLRMKELSVASFDGWGKVVVSGHTKCPAERASPHTNAPHYADPWRITLDSGTDGGGPLYGVELPARRILEVSARGPAKDITTLR